MNVVAGVQETARRYGDVRHIMTIKREVEGEWDGGRSSVRSRQHLVFFNDFFA